MSSSGILSATQQQSRTEPTGLPRTSEQNQARSNSPWAMEDTPLVQDSFTKVLAAAADDGTIINKNLHHAYSTSSFKGILTGVLLKSDCDDASAVTRFPLYI
jgi:hypothetical protein